MNNPNNNDRQQQQGGQQDPQRQQQQGGQDQDRQQQQQQDQDRDRQRAFEAGFDVHLVKPSSAQELQLVAGTLERATARNASGIINDPSASIR